MANTPVYQTTLTVTIQYPASSPEEAYALHKEFVGAMRSAAETLTGPTWAGLAELEQVRTEIGASDGPVLIVDQEVPETEARPGDANPPPTCEC